MIMLIIEYVCIDFMIFSPFLHIFSNLKHINVLLIISFVKFYHSRYTAQLYIHFLISGTTELLLLLLSEVQGAVRCLKCLCQSFVLVSGFKKIKMDQTTMNQSFNQFNGPCVNSLRISAIK